MFTILVAFFAPIPCFGLANSSVSPGPTPGLTPGLASGSVSTKGTGYNPFDSFFGFDLGSTAQPDTTEMIDSRSTAAAILTTQADLPTTLAIVTTRDTPSDDQSTAPAQVTVAHEGSGNNSKPDTGLFTAIDSPATQKAAANTTTVSTRSSEITQRYG